MSATITVTPGDTLSKLSLMYSVSPSRLRELNNLHIRDVHPGDVLKIESPLEYLQSQHQLVVMLISSLDFFRENLISNQENGITIHDEKLKNDLDEFILLRSAISGSVVLTEDMLIFNQMPTNKILNRDKYTFYINLVAISHTNLVPFYKHYSKSHINHEIVRKIDNDFKGSQNEQEHKVERKQAGSLSFFKRLFVSKSEQKLKIDANVIPQDSKENSNNLNDDNNENKNSQSSAAKDIDHTRINFGGVESFTNLYEDEPSILEISLFDDPLNKNQGLKSISFFASRAELNSLEFLINFFSRQRRIEIGLRLVSSSDLPTVLQQNDSETTKVKACHSSSMPIPQTPSATTLKKSSLVLIVHDEQEKFPNYEPSDEDSKILIDGHGSFGYAIQTTTSYVPENHNIPKKISKVDPNRKVGSLIPQSPSSSPLFTPQVLTKSVLNTMSPISCHSLQLSNLSISETKPSFITSSFSYSEYPASLTDSTSLILDCVNVTMIRSNFPHRIIGLAWKLAFRLSRDGCSYQSLLEKTRDGHPCVLAILTNKGERIGAFLAEGIKEGKSKSTGGSSFVFTFSNSRQNIKDKMKPNSNSSTSENNNTNDDDDSNNNNDEVSDNIDNDDLSNNSNDYDNNNIDNDDSNDNNNNINNNESNEKNTIESNASKPPISYFNRRNAHVYKWSMLNNKFVIVSTTDLMIGSTSISDDKDKFKDRSLIFSKYRNDFAGRFGAAIWIDQKMNKGISENCPTFNSPPLVEGGTFSVNDIEVWNII